jgi:hypothetical protein
MRVTMVGGNVVSQRGGMFVGVVFLIGKMIDCTCRVCDYNIITCK